MLYTVTFRRSIGTFQCSPESQNWITETPDEAISKARDELKARYRHD